ncbi:MAG TPA: hypothetical protein VLL97_00650 [Acidobacteriota bacterium]|nr:hypothetical protein [Acidobacteriota bacterium]
MKKQKNSMLPSLLFAAFALAAGMHTGLYASKNTLMQIASDRLVDGWKVVPESTTYGLGDGLWDIYNGGYEVYTEAGVVEALRRLYTRDNDYVEVTVHTMNSPRSARAFLEDRHKMETGKEAPRIPEWNSFLASGAGSTTLYAITGSWFITVVAHHEGEKGKQQTTLFLKPMIEKASKLPSGKN